MVILISYSLKNIEAPYINHHFRLILIELMYLRNKLILRNPAFMKIRLFFFGVIILFASCAKLPIQSVTLVESIMAEGKRMHSINKSLVNDFFNEKRNKIDEFIRKDYTPKYIEEFTKKIPNDVDIKAELPGIILSIIPKINERRDAMQNALEQNRIKILEKLNQDYDEYEIACIELKQLLESAVKVDDIRKKVLNKTSELTQNKLDFGQLEGTINGFITNSGDFSQSLINLNEGVNKLLNK
jgi:hypothetical protein